MVMIKILLDYDIFIINNPWAPYEEKPWNTAYYIETNIELFRKLNKGKIKCYCTICEMEFIRNKPNDGICPFERHHRPEAPNINTIERMLS